MTCNDGIGEATCTQLLEADPVCSVLITFQFSQRTVACDLMFWRAAGGAAEIGDMGGTLPIRLPPKSYEFVVKPPQYPKIGGKTFTYGGFLK